MAKSLTDAEFDVIHDALYNNQILVFKDQSHVTPRAQFELTRRFDPKGTSYGHGKTIDAKRSILHPDLKTIRESLVHCNFVSFDLSAQRSNDLQPTSLRSRSLAMASCPSTKA